MALKDGTSVTVSSATQSDHISLGGQGDWLLRCSSAGAFVLDIQEGGTDGASFADVYLNATNKATIDSSTGPQSYRVSGGYCYRMDVTTYNNPITMVATRCED
jgi:hypothetical protein